MNNLTKSLCIDHKKAFATFIIVMIPVIAFFIGRYIKQKLLVHERIQLMYVINMINYGQAENYLYRRISELKYLDEQNRYPVVKLLIFEGDNAKGYPSDNSWRSNCDVDQDGGSLESHPKGAPSRLSWKMRSDYYPRPFLPFCWKNRHGKNIDSQETLYTNVMTIKGSGTITDLMLTGKYDENDKTQDEMICLIEVNNLSINWAQKGDIDIENLPDNLTSGIDGIGVTVRFRDGEIWYLKKDVPLSLLKQFMTIDGVKNHPREELKKYRIGRFNGIYIDFNYANVYLFPSLFVILIILLFHITLVGVILRRFLLKRRIGILLPIMTLILLFPEIAYYFFFRFMVSIF